MKSLLISLALASICFSPIAQAAGLSIGITPTLIELSVAPNQSWDSSIRVINSNDFDLTLYAIVRPFRPEGEGGLSSFGEIDSTISTLANWLEVTNEPIVVPRESSYQVPITVRVPEQADPGGHYAAIQFSTQPPSLAENTSAIRTTQIVTALMFAKVAGDIQETGRIRSFRTSKRVYGTTEAQFELRFENTGNVHLQPNGRIVITNMWGAERGVLPINRNTQFGNVLPNSIRLYDLRWISQFSLADIGRYTAELQLVYGDQQVQSVVERIHFWVIPIGGLAIVFTVLLSIILFIRWAVRSYVKRMLVLAGVDPNIHRGVPVSVGKLKGKDVRINRASRVVRPLQTGIEELQESLASQATLTSKIDSLASFLLRYRLFFVGVITACIFMILLLLFVLDARQPAVPYEVTYTQNGNVTTVSSDQIEYESASPASSIVPPEVSVDQQAFSITIINASGVSGTTVSTRRTLESAGYVVNTMTTDLVATKKRSVILYNPEYLDIALQLSELLGGVLLSAQTTATEGGDIIISVGEDNVVR